jgi:hypothetical protein
VLRRVLLAVLLAGSMTFSGVSACGDPSGPDCSKYLYEVCTRSYECCEGVCRDACCTTPPHKKCLPR